MKNIKNIIFDFGGVILNIDIQLTIKEFKKLNFKDFDKFALKTKQDNFFKNIETGKMTSDEFYKYINAELKQNIPEKTIKTAWNKLLLDYPPGNIKILSELKKKYRLFLLSNTNEIHYNKYIPDFKKQFGFELHSLFEKTYFSHQIGMRKPNENIFVKVLEENKLNPSETIFIDDLKENRIAAGNIGIISVEIKQNSGLSGLFK